MSKVISPILTDGTGMAIAQAINHNTATQLAINTASYDADGTLLEVQDARTINETQYASLGEAIRAEVTRIDGELGVVNETLETNANNISELISKTNKNTTDIANVNDILTLTSSFKSAYGEIGLDDNLVIQGSMICEYISRTKCNIHISCKIAENISPTNTTSVISRAKIRSLLGIDKLNFDHMNTRVIVTTHKDDTYGLDYYSGLSGLKAHTGGSAPDAIAIGRMHDLNGAPQFGNWQRTAKLFSVGATFEIDLYGCEYN